MTAIVTCGDAANLQLPDKTVDLVVTSPPYFGLRSYQDGGEHYAGQVGDEATPTEYLDALIACTAEWARVLKPGGSIFVNLGDKYSTYVANRGTSSTGIQNGTDPRFQTRPSGSGLDAPGIRYKSLVGLPWRYAIRCIDELGLILRAEIVWAKPNGLPESVTDRVRRSHEQVFHFVKYPRYYSAVDEIREAHSPVSIARAGRNRFAPDLTQQGIGSPNTLNPEQAVNPLGKLPGSVWTIPTAPLTVPESLGIDHFAAYPPELVRRIVLGWSPREVCTACGEGRRPVATDVGWARGKSDPVRDTPSRHRSPLGPQNGNKEGKLRALSGDRCACGFTGEGGTWTSSSGLPPAVRGGQSAPAAGEASFKSLASKPTRTGTTTFGQPPPTTPGVVLDPFGGTGTSALVASCYGRVGISVDLSADYCRLARWRTTDPGERARVLGVEKPPVQVDGQLGMFEDGAA